jgi:hypothetical protein
VSSPALTALRDPRRDVEGASGSFSLLGVLGFLRELSPPFLREPFRRADEGCGVFIFSSAASVGWLSFVSLRPFCGVGETDSAEDMAGLSLGSTFVRLARLLRAGASPWISGSGSGLELGGAAFLLRPEAGARVGGGGGGGSALLSLAEPVDRLAAERVTLDDMRFWF